GPVAEPGRARADIEALRDAELAGRADDVVAVCVGGRGYRVSRPDHPPVSFELVHDVVAGPRLDSDLDRLADERGQRQEPGQLLRLRAPQGPFEVLVLAHPQPGDRRETGVPARRGRVPPIGEERVPDGPPADAE